MLEENAEWPGVWFHLFLLHRSRASALFQALGRPWGHTQEGDVVPACTPLSQIPGGDKLRERLKHGDQHFIYFFCLLGV